MSQHGYLHDSYDSNDYGDDRSHDDRRHERADRNMMFDRGERGPGHRERSSWRDRDDDRGFSSQVGDRARSWFRDDEDEGGRLSSRSGGDSDGDEWFGGRRSQERGTGGYGREHGLGGFQGDYGRSGHDQRGFGGRPEWQQGRQTVSAHPDDHYRSWRDKQIEALDRDYQDYCREREQQFHQDFDSWRSTRQAQASAAQQAPQGAGSDDVMTLNQPTTATPENQSTDGTAATANSETSSTGRGRR